jgi:ubiquinone/menaquinone biosynthesis C-methylase UbiE
MSGNIPKPSHLSPAYASQFQDPAIARAYLHRPPYPDNLFPTLVELIGPRVQRVLDLGTGTGPVARGLADLVDHVDAVDFSLPLLEVARSLPKGNRPNIRWIHSSAEEAPLDPPYGLVTAGSSLHWMDWYVVLPRVKLALQSGGYLAIFDEATNSLPWSNALNQLIPLYSTNKEFRPYKLLDELTARNLFKPVGRIRVASMSFTQTIDDHVESMHARNGFSRDRMSPDMAARFDQHFKSLVEPHCPDGIVTMDVFTKVIYGVPMP